MQAYERHIRYRGTAELSAVMMYMHTPVVINRKYLAEPFPYSCYYLSGYVATSNDAVGKLSPLEEGFYSFFAWKVKLHNEMYYQVCSCLDHLFDEKRRGILIEKQVTTTHLYTFNNEDLPVDFDKRKWFKCMGPDCRFAMCSGCMPTLVHTTRFFCSYRCLLGKMEKEVKVPVLHPAGDIIGINTTCKINCLHYLLPGSPVLTRMLRYLSEDTHGPESDRLRRVLEIPQVRIYPSGNEIPSIVNTQDCQNPVETPQLSLVCEFHKQYLK